MNRLIVCVFVLLCTPSVSQADLTEFTDNFTNNFFADFVEPANWDVGFGATTFTFLRDGDSDDGDLLDAAGDGYATLRGLVSANGGAFSPLMTREIGVVEASNVGMLIELDLSYLEVVGGANVTAGIASDGVFLSQMSASTLGADPDSGLLTASYIVDAADIGSTLDVQFQFATSTDTQTMAIDAAIVTISVVPEPSSLVVLLGIAGIACPVRRRVA